MTAPCSYSPLGRTASAELPKGGEWRARGSVGLDRELEAIDRTGLSPMELRLLLRLRSDWRPLHRAGAAELRGEEPE
jgi:hypothetical protein